MRKALFAFLLFPSLVLAQENTGTILGTVLDASGAAVPGVKITVTNELTGLVRTTETAADGAYIVPLVPVGRYRVDAEQKGFQKISQSGVTLDVNQKARLDFTLQVGSVEQAVQVVANTVQVDTAGSTLGTVVDERKIEDLPLNGRQFIQLGTLLPGTVPTQGRMGQFGNLTAYSVAGQRNQSNNFTMDGVTNNDTVNSGIVLTPPPDAISEFKILTHNFSAEYGHNSGGVVNVVTKSGTNGFHGSLWEFLRNDKMDARNFFAHTPGAVKPALKQNQFGGTFGGPIQHDKTFFFGYYEGLINRTGATTQNVIVLSPLERTGDFSQSAVKPRNPATGQPYPNNTVAVNPISANFISKFLSVPNAPGNRNVISPTQQNNNNQEGVRMDHRFSDRNALFGRYSIQGTKTFNPIAPGTNFSPAGSNALQRFQHATISDTYLITSQLVNEASVAFVRQRLNPVTWSGQKLSDLGLNYTSTEGTAVGLPSIGVSGLFTVGDTQQNFTYLTRNTYQALDNLSWVHGRHSLKWGFNFSREQFFLVFPNRPNGDFTFDGSVTGNPAADFLIGQSFLFRQGGGDFSKHFFGTTFGGYGRDDFRVTSRLTLNLGLRYDVPRPYYDKYNRVASFQPGKQSTVYPNAPPGLLFPGDAGVPRATIQTEKDMFAPRIGLAWDPFGNGKTSVRAGYGVFWDTVPGVEAFENILVPPFNRFIQINNVSISNPYAGFAINPQIDPKGQFPCPCLIIGFSPDLLNPYSQHFSLDIQRQLGGNFLADIGYVGSTGTHFPGYTEINPAVQTPTATAGNIPQRRIYPSYNLLRPAFSMFNSNYHSLQASLNKRFSKGYSFLASYTWSKAIDFQSGVNLNPDNQPQRPFDLKDVRGLANLDARHRFVFSSNWELPFFSGAKGRIRNVLGGWQVNAILAFQSGNPVTATEPTDRSLMGLNFVDRPDQICNPNNGPKTPEQWFTTSCFVRLPAKSPGGQRPGTAGRNTITAPGISNVDFSVIKNFSLFERHKFQYRAEMFNLLNHPNFNVPVTNIGALNFGALTSAQPARIIQMGLKYSF